MIKSYLKSYLYLFGIIIISTLVISIINYFINIPIKKIKIIISIISLFISSIILGRNVKNKAYLEAIKFSSIYLIIITILKFIFKTSFNYKVIIMYLVLIISSIIGSMIGINSKNK